MPYPSLLQVPNGLKKKMSSYGAIGLDNDDLDPLIAATREAPAVRAGRGRQRSASASDTQAVSIRQPYMFTGGIGLSREGSRLSLQSEEDFRDHNMALRYRLYNRLDPGGHQLRMPDHVTPAEYFSILPFDDMKDSSGKQGSIVTIFSLWNTMMGTSLLAMPWAMQQAGLIGGLFLMLILAMICLYTAYRVIDSPHNLPGMPVDPSLAEFSDVCSHLYGKVGEMTAVLFSIVVLLGGVIVYWVLMSNFLYYTGYVVHEALSNSNSSIIPDMENNTFLCDISCPVQLERIGLEESPWETSLLDYSDNESFWNFNRLWQLQGTVPIYLGFLTFPLMNFKSPTFFTKFNVLGTISVMYLLIFTGSKLSECGFNMNFTDPNSMHYVKLFNWKFPALTGTLTLSYFIHNAVLTILRNQKHPENNVRDLSIGYFLCAFCYMFIGFTFFAGFPAQRSCISDNFLNNFGAGDIMSSTARMFLLFQMITVLPLLMYLIRSQFFYATMGKTWPGIRWVILLNIGVVSIAATFAIFYPKVGSILRYVGSLSGLVYVFTLPCLMYMRKLYLEDKLTTTKKIIHISIISLGVLNLLAQFFV